MNRLNLWTVALLMGIMVFLSGPSLCQAADNASMNNAQFADILVKVLGIEMPLNADILSDAELFEVQANMLAERGITLFVDAEPDGWVSRSNLADVCYDALIGPNDVVAEDKIAYLVSLDYMSFGAPGDVMNSDDIINTLNIPELSKAVAETYIRLGLGPLAPRGTIVSPTPFNVERESFLY